MRDEFKPAIAALQSDLAELERKMAETKRAINRLCELAGAPLLYANVDAAESRPSVAAMRTDQFYGKVLNTAAREYLDMRKSANLGPATPREIYEALIAGGFKFDTKSEINAMTSLRQTLRKNSSTFHRLPHGSYGLLVWYPNAKAAKHDEDDEVAEPRSYRRQQKKPPRRAARGKKSRPDKAARSEPDTNDSGLATREESISITPLVLSTLSDGADWTVGKLKEAATKWNVPGLTEDAMGRKLQGTLLSLNRQKMIVSVGNGAWRKADRSAADTGNKPAPAAA